MSPATSVPSPDPIVRVRFPLVQDGAGWPPCSAETLWARPAGDLYEITSVPFFVPDVHRGDLIAAMPGEEEMLEFVKVVEASGHETVLATPLGLQALAVVVGAARALGCSVESAEDRELIAIDVPPVADTEELNAWLDGAEADGLLVWYLNDTDEALAPEAWDATRGPGVTCACCGVPLVTRKGSDEVLVLLDVGLEATPFWRTPYGEEQPQRAGQRRQCPACRARRGRPHNRECPREECPNCVRPLFSCPCPVLAWGRALEEEA
jgi:hypothetical protein